ncbi:hypothetical protein JKF54_01650 [Wolbachia endosymbiont of Spodoptera picta]|uniref:TomO hydrophobic C-terminal domain-containing protein n=1 Tax=Wolbachia endosymbiont of Spodoptera picta TaxID=2769078 RepID=UPI001BADF19D|nr:hypothetical protein [Wolbachia endosymbiont of Spodoptera picta]QUI60664.1 hypothetical protein JKF54_01650 [Wolbachia endosymbiont of Spodoptera picta]
MQFNSGGIGQDSLTYQNVKNLSLKENSIRNPKKTGKENRESAAISVARVGASVEEKTAARSCPYARKTKTRIENLPPKRNSIRNLDLNRIGKENSESAAISVARIDANAEKKTTARNHLCRKRAGTQVEEDLVFPKKVKTLLFRVEGSNSIIGNQNELKVRQVEAELDKASNLLEEKQSSFDSQAVQPEESKTKIEEAQKEISDERDQLERELEGSSNAAIELNNKVKELEEKNDQVNELNEKVFSIETERNTLKDQITKIQNELARKESEIGRLNDQLSKSYQHIEQLKQDKNKKEEELLDQQNKVKELNDKVNSITNERNCLNGQIETQLLEKNKEFDEFKKERDTLTNQVQEKKNELSAKEEAFSKVQTNAQDLTYEVNQKDQQLEQVVREKQRLEAKFRGLNEKYSEVKNKDRGYIENLTCKLRQAKSEFIDNENKLSDQIEKLKEEKEILLEQLRAKSTGSASFRKQQSKIDSLKQQIKQKEEPKSVRNLEQLQNISGQNKIETTVPENSAESELNSTRLTEFEGNNIHVQASAAPAATVTSMNVKNIEKVPVMLETPSDKSGSQKLVSVQQEMSSVANESSGQVNGSQTNGMQPNNSSNGSIIVTQSVQKNKWPTTATWKLAIAGVLAGIAASVAYFTFSASLLVTGVIAGVGACCLVAAAIVYYCNKPSSSLEKSSIDKVAVNGYTAAASCE